MTAIGGFRFPSPFPWLAGSAAARSG